MVDLRREDAVLVLRLHEGAHAMSGPWLADVHAALDEAEATVGETALVTTGHDRWYSTGLDLEWFSRSDAQTAEAAMASFHRLLARVLAFPMISVAALNGHAFAGGAMLAAAHDRRVMRDDRGYWCLPEVDMASGRAMTEGMTALLRARLGPHAFHEACVTGHRYTAVEAQAAGIVEEARPNDEVLSAATASARALAGKHRPTVAALKRGMYEHVLGALERSAVAGVGA